MIDSCIDLSCLAQEIGKRMQDPEQVKKIILDPENKNPDSLSSHSYWEDLSLASGYPGILLLLSALDFRNPEGKWDEVSHNYILKIKEVLEEDGIVSLSLYSGLAGVCFAIECASREGTRYQQLLKTLDHYLCSRMQEEYFSPILYHLASGHSIPLHLYDLIQGIAGIGLYSLKVHRVEMISSILQLCVRITQSIEREGYQVPGWFLASESHFQEADRQRFKKGSFNLGLAHGIPGVLGLLSKAYLQGYEVEGQKEAIERIVVWLQEHRQKMERSFVWGGMISFEKEIARDYAIPYVRDAWCYGTPGVARSLFLAGRALGDSEVQCKAKQAIESVFLKEPQGWNLPGPTICHGLSGLLLIAREFGLTERVDFLQKKILADYNSESPFGFQDQEPCRKGGHVGVNKVGLLEGATGVLLSLLPDHPGEPDWKLPFCI